MRTMQDELEEEISALAAQVSEQLAFFREIGITDIGDSRRPPASASEVPSGLDHEISQSVSSAGSGGGISPDIGESYPATVNFLEGASGPGQTQPSPPQLNLFGEPVLPQSLATLGSQSPIAQFGGFINAPIDRSLDDIRNDIGDCVRCRLHEHRTNIVFGEGNPEAELVFVGEGPGADEDRSGRPFVGKAGKLLDKIIEAIGMNRAEVYIANVVKCRPPENRTPERDESATCGPFLFRQLGVIRPKVIVALGGPALQCLTGSREGITKARGNWKEWRGIPVMPTYHPAYLLRSPDKKKDVWEDMKKVRDYILRGEFCS